MIDLVVEPGLADTVSLGLLTVDELHVTERSDSLAAALGEAVARLRHAQPPETTMAAVRAMYHRVGLDPTKIRPSSEALWRRVRRGLELPQINVLVDVCNWCSLEFQLPYGLYDRDRIQGRVVFRLGRAGEEYAGIRREVVHVAGRPVLADEAGPFGNPTADSARTMITSTTTRALVVIFAPRQLDRTEVAHALDRTAARILEFVGGRETARRVL